MEEKKLNSEEIVKALKCCGDDHMSCSSENCPLWKHTTCQSQLAREARDFMERLQGEKKELEDLCNKTYDDLTKEIDRLQSENKQLSLVAGIVNKGVAVEIVNMQEKIDKQKAEIERLTEENSNLKKLVKSLEDLKETLLQERAEQIKQVDELTAFKNEAISMSLYGKGRKDGEEVAVKDTAKEIYSEINSCIEQGQDYCGLDWRGLLTAKNIILVYCKKKGVEVE